MNRRQFLAGSVGMTIAAPVLAQLPDAVKKAVKVRENVHERQVVFHTPFDRVTGGGMAAGELCYLTANGFIARDCYFNELRMIEASVQYRTMPVYKVMGGKWVTSVIGLVSFESLSDVRKYALDNDYLAIVDGTNCVLNDLDRRVADFVIKYDLFLLDSFTPVAKLTKNRYGEKMVYFG